MTHCCLINTNRWHERNKTLYSELLRKMKRSRGRDSDPVGDYFPSKTFIPKHTAVLTAKVTSWQVNGFSYTAHDTSDKSVHPHTHRVYIHLYVTGQPCRLLDSAVHPCRWLRKRMMRWTCYCSFLGSNIGALARRSTNSLCLT